MKAKSLNFLFGGICLSLGCGALIGCAEGGETAGNTQTPSAGGSASGGGSAAGGSAATGGNTTAGGSAGTGASAGTGGTAAAGGTATAGTGGATGATGGTAASGGNGGSAGSGGTPPVTDFGEPCQGDGECDSGVCIEGPDGNICTKPCAEECPEDWRCGEIPGSSDPSGYCIPRFNRLCRPCVADSDCRIPNVPGESSRCIQRGEEGSFCGVTCSDTEPCSDGYTCDVIDIGGNLTKQCVRDGGEICECKDTWAGKGYSTLCSQTNGHGTCTGARDCDTGTLSDCTAAAPAAEVCDGEDNNCNSATDEGELCDDSLPCTTDVCNGAQKCSNELQAGSCNIGFDCYADGETNDTNACERCVSSRDPVGWTKQDASCAIDDDCHLIGTPHPSIDCMLCNPILSVSSWSLHASRCYIGNACYEDGDTEGSNPCSICAIGRSQSSWSNNTGESCDDGNACTGTDKCQANRSCAGTLINDGNEPDGTVGQASNLGGMSNECDDNGKTGSGKLAGSGDIDWYYMLGPDTWSTCVVSPHVTTSGGASLEVCMYIKCRNGTTTHGNDVNCANGSSNATHGSLNGYAGCCLTGVNPTFGVGLDCDGTDETSDVYVRVSKLGAGRQCTDYSVYTNF